MTTSMYAVALRMILPLSLLGSPSAILAQTSPPIIRAHASQVDIQDGDQLLKGAWSVDPTVALNVYAVRRSAQGKKVTFITDLDSMSFDVLPGRTYDFVILLDGRPCPTRISTLPQPFRRAGSAPASGPASIPISISNGKLHLQGRFNDSELLDLIFDTGADTNVLYPSALGKGVRLQFDGSVNNAGTGGRTLRQTSSNNQLGIADLRWEHEPVLYVEKQADAADGIVGYTVFQDKVVELDFDQKLMHIHEVLPAHAGSFTKTAMPYLGTLTAVETGFGLGSRREAGLLLLDTGGNGTLTLNPAFASAHGLPGTMRKIGRSEMRGVGSGVVRSDVLMLPELTLAGHTLRSVPINMELPSEGEPSPPGGALFMEVLSRFHIVLDYPRNEAYFKPNGRFRDPFKMRSSGPPWYAKALLAMLATASLAGLALFVARRRRPAAGTPTA